jgi:cytochrome c-type biogenesis protein CcmH
VRAAAAAAAAVTALAVVGPALASEQHPTLQELEGEVMCLVCGTTLDQSSSLFADRERAIIRSYIAAGDTKSQIEDKLVAQFGPQILAAPPRSGFNLLAWWLPIAGVVGGAVALGYLAWRWSRGRREPPDPPAGGSSNGRLDGPIDPALEQQLDVELARYDV